MVITKITEGFSFIDFVDTYAVKMTYIGYSKKESISRFKKLIKEQKIFIKSLKS